MKLCINYFPAIDIPAKIQGFLVREDDGIGFPVPFHGRVSGGAVQFAQSMSRGFPAPCAEVAALE
jgi:hypothetical protein